MRTLLPNQNKEEGCLIDWAGKWFSIAKDRGENHIVSFGRGIPDQTNNGYVEEFENFDFSHIKMDGIAAMNRQLGRLGQRLASFPQLKNQTPLKGHKKILAILMALKKQTGHQTQWKQNDFQAKTSSSPKVMGFTLEETKEILHSLNLKKWTLDSFLLSRLDQEVRNLLSSPQQHSKWLFPINMRGQFYSSPHLLNNQVSFISLIISPIMDPDEIQKQIKYSLQNGEHWGNWSISSIGKYLGTRGMRYLSYRSSKKNFWMGTFSNLGQWKTDPHYQALHPTEVWFASPPGSANYPVGFIHCIFNGKLSLSLKAHPFICAPSDWEKKTLLFLRHCLTQLHQKNHSQLEI